MATKKSSDGRARNWVFIIYPGDSAPDNWQEILDSYHIKWAESPLHDKDINPDGTQKKTHKHIMLLFDGNKSFSQIKQISDSLNAPIPEIVANVKAHLRYFAHLDNPEKYQYRKEDIIAHGFDIIDYFGIGRSDVLRCVREMQFYIKENNITEFQDIMDYALSNESDWYECLVFHSERVINAYIRSQRLRENTNHF